MPPAFKMGTAVEDYGDFPPWFFESGGEEGLYDDSNDAPAPSEDIWKKFELLPTPPLSPKHETYYPMMPGTGHDLRQVSDLLQDDNLSKTSLLSLTEVFSMKCKDTCCNFNSKLIHDCMWSGHNVPQNVKLGQSKELNTSRTRNSSFSLCIDTSSCVDPNVAAVFPYPVNDQTRQVQRESSLGAETPSDSDDDDEDSSSEEDEEIDVVTVAEIAQQQRVRQTKSKPVLPATTTASAHVAAMHNYTASPRSVKVEPASPAFNRPSAHSCLVGKRPRSHNHQHNSQPSVKKTKLSVSSAELRAVINHHKYQRHHRGQSRCSSDSEDSDGRRAQHNVLERKRRNDLKSSFHTLRDNIPDLHSQERAAKVTILKKATDFIMSLRRQHQTLATELDRQKRTHDALQRRLRQLRSK